MVECLLPLGDSERRPKESKVRRHVGEVERYAGKPLLRILECYVLHVIGELDVDTQEKFAALSPKLGEVYGRTGDWIAIVSSELSLPDDLPTGHPQQAAPAVARPSGELAAPWRRVNSPEMTLVVT